MQLTMVQHITQTPGLRGGKPHIAGTRITVSDIAYFHLRMGMSVAHIAAVLEKQNPSRFQERLRKLRGE